MQEAMKSTADELNHLLRVMLTAINQQSVHLLYLRSRGVDDLGKRIGEVDRSDFPSTLALIDHMVRTRTPLRMASEPFCPGACEQSILLAEQSVETGITAALAPLSGHGGAVGRLVAAVGAPRAAYADWIAHRLDAATRGAEPDHRLTATLSPVFAGLSVMGEQALIHAFVHWHRGSKRDADAAWGVSGAAMIKAGAIVYALADKSHVPFPETMPHLELEDEPAAAFAADRRLAEHCAGLALLGGERCEAGAERDLALSIAEAASAWARRAPGEPLGADAGSSRTFASFERTRQKFLERACDP